MEDDRLAVELLREIKSTCRRWFILFIITLIMLFGTNLMWLCAWNLPCEETVIAQDCETYGTNNFIGNDGDINGKTDN